MEFCRQIFRVLEMGASAPVDSRVFMQLFNIIDQQRRDQAVIEATDAARRQKGTRREARSVAAAGTKLQGNAADKPEGSQSAKTAGVKAEQNRQYEKNECFCLW